MVILVISGEKERDKISQALSTHFLLRVVDEEGLFEEERLSGDLAIVSLDLPGAAGEEVRELMRKMRDNIPVLAIVDRDFSWEETDARDFDDFIYEDFQAEELRSRVYQLLFRFRSISTEHILRIRDLLFDFDRCEVRFRGKALELTYKEYELLRFLATHPDKVFTREILLEQVWGYGYYGGSRTVDVHIRRIRSKIDTADHTYIRTVRGAGYIFEP